MDKKRYVKRAEELAPKSKSSQNLAMAFIVGGIICAIGEEIVMIFEMLGFKRDEASAFCTLILILTSVVLTNLKLYDRIAKYAGAGTLVPITGFANAASSAAMEYKSEGFILGVGAKIFNICGPVIVYGVISSAIYGMVVLAIDRFFG